MCLFNVFNLVKFIFENLLVRRVVVRTSLGVLPDKFIAYYVFSLLSYSNLIARQWNLWEHVSIEY